MHRFYISPENWNPDALSLSGPESHHARDVLRMKRGDRAVLFNGRGREITAEIVDLAGGEVRLRRLQETETPPLRCRITLGQAIPKGKKTKWHQIAIEAAKQCGQNWLPQVHAPRKLKDFFSHAGSFDLRLIGSL